METTWKKITEADMQRTVMSPLLEAQRTAALATAQADPMIGAIEDAVAETRAIVQSCERNSVSSDTTTVPPSLRATTCWIALSYIAKRLSVIKLTQDQKDEIAAARETLDEVAACKRAVETPSEALSPGDAQRGGGASVVCPDTDYRTTTASQRSGLI